MYPSDLLKLPCASADGVLDAIHHFGILDELCDRYGIYVVDEANVESHGMGYGDNTLAKAVMDSSGSK